MQSCELQEDTLVENVICDKNVIVSEGKWLKGAENYPLIIEKIQLFKMITMLR